MNAPERCPAEPKARCFAKQNMLNVVVVANGIITDYDFIQQMIEDCDYLVACDGGLKHLYKLGINPDFIVGDLDSASGDLLDLYRDIPLQKFSAEKDFTDLELALAHACNEGADSIVVLGGLGGRFDHQLANVHVLAQAVERGVSAELCDENLRIRLITDYCRLQRQDGILVTLIPLSTTADGVVTEGLKYPLKDESLKVGFARGVSNQIVDEYAAVSLKKGLLVVIQMREECERSELQLLSSV